MSVDVLLGLQWGDEGKGKIVDALASEYDIVARFQGGPNAGHTLVFDDKKIVLHTIPSGIFHDRPINIIGNGVVINPTTFKQEIDQLMALGIDVHKKLFISKKAHLILPTHCILDKASEAAKGTTKVGSTLKGIGPTYMDKTGRNGLRAGDILSPNFKQRYEQLKEKHKKILALYKFEYDIESLEKDWFQAIELIKTLNLIDGEYFINNELAKGKKILAEGAQGALLDIDFGTYPFVTSSNTITASACIGLGVPPHAIKEVIGIAKAYCTRVGEGPFPSELNGKVGEQLREKGHEVGATTGRPRRCGWMDIPALQYSAMLNGITQLVITKIDVLNDFDPIKVCTHYKLNNKVATATPRIVNTLPYQITDNNISPVWKSFKGWKKSIEGIDRFENLPLHLKEFLTYLENSLFPLNKGGKGVVPGFQPTADHPKGGKITMISTGPQREKLIRRN